MTETPPANASQVLQVSQTETEPSTPLLETDYEAIAAAVMETDRGRWFLQEYARRNRNADTQSVLTAINKLEKRISENDTAPKQATSVALLSHDLIDLAGAISQVKKEVAELGGQGNDPDHFNSATVELEAIVEQTESATSEILEAAEKIQEVTWILREEGASETQCDIIDSKIVEVYTACSFQDLTGQRSNKVVQLVGYVERRIASMMNILGLSDDEISSPSNTASSDNTPSESAPGLTPEQRKDTRPDAKLLNGPAMTGEGNEQGDVDALFDDVVFNEAPDFGSDTSGLMDPEMLSAEADDETSETSSFDNPEASDEDVTSSSADDDDLEFRPLETEPEEASGDDFTAVSSTVTSVEDEEAEIAPESVDTAQKADFGKDSERANTPEAADVFGFDVYGDGQLVELQDAEILSEPAEEEIVKSAQATQPKQDIFEIDPLSYGGATIGETENAELDEKLEAETDGAPKMVVGLPGDFDVDSHVADMFVGSGDVDAKSADDPAPTGNEENDLIDGQDIFEAESIDVDSDASDDEAAVVLAHDGDAESAFADAMVADHDDHETDNQNLHPQDALVSDDFAAADAEEPIAQYPSEEETPGEIAAGTVEAADDVFDEDAIDDAFANLEADAALEAEKASEAISLETAELDIAENTEVEAGDREQVPAEAEAIAVDEPALHEAINAAEDLIGQSLESPTTASAKEPEYPDDEYTVEERIALFS